MLEYTTAKTKEELEGILRLQKINLPAVLSVDEITSQGFVTVDHSYEQLKKMNNLEQHIIAKDNHHVVGYLLAMTKECKADIPVLVPMFAEFGNIIFDDRKISDYRYIVVGQVCVDKNYRGQGILDKCYEEYRNHFSQKFDFAITEIAATNLRSLNAHKRIGFKEVHRYAGPDNTEWIVVLWDWRNIS